MSTKTTSIVRQPVDGKWLRKIGFTYHALGKYYYMRTINDILLVEAKDSESDPDCQWWLSVVAGQVDPADYVDLAGQLTGRATREDVLAVVEICERERHEI